MLPNLNINKDVMLRGASSGFLNATDMADYLVTKGAAFRDAHACIGKAVSYAIGKQKELHELTLEEMRSFSPLFSPDVFDLLTPVSMVLRRKSFGGTAPENVLLAIKKAKKDIGRERQKRTFNRAVKGNDF